MRRTFFFIVALLSATSSFASLPRASMLDRASEHAPAAADPLPETRVWASDVLAPFERPAETELTRALHQAYADLSTTNASGLGRFLSVDPGKDWNPKQPQSWNMYAYVRNNPINGTDPNGRQMKRDTPCNGDSDKCTKKVVPIDPAEATKVATTIRLAPTNAPTTIMRSATNGTPPTPGAVTVSAGLTANFVAIGGGSVNVSGMRTANRIGPEHSAFAVTGGVHTASPRASVGVQATVGLFRGTPADQRGATTEVNFSLMTVGASLVFSNAGGFLGGSLSYGPAVGAGISTSESGTAVLTGQDVLNKVDVDPWR